MTSTLHPSSAADNEPVPPQPRDGASEPVPGAVDGRPEATADSQVYPGQALGVPAPGAAPGEPGRVPFPGVLGGDTASRPFPSAAGGETGGGPFAVATAGGPGYPYPYAYAPPGRIGAFFQRLGERMPGWLAPAGVALCVAGGMAYTLFADPTAADADSQPTCVMKMLTGFDCPGCGGTRAAWYLLHGDIAAAARHHLPLVFATPFLIYMYIAWTLSVVTKRKLLPQLRLPNTVLAGFLAAWIVFSIVRNLPWAPFTWLYV